MRAVLSLCQSAWRFLRNRDNLPLSVPLVGLPAIAVYIALTRKPQAAPVALAMSQFMSALQVGTRRTVAGWCATNASASPRTSEFVLCTPAHPHGMSCWKRLPESRRCHRLVAIVLLEIT